MIGRVAAALLFATLFADSALPIIEVPASGNGHYVAVLITGDGGWASGDKALASQLAAHGVPVVALNARAYFFGRRTPDETARDWERIAHTYMQKWSRDSVVYVGYSRGADVAPFVLSRISPDLRRRVALVALVGLAERASFEFHWEDLVREVHRPTDLQTRPEMERIRGMRILCMYGQDERESLCPTLDEGLASVARHPGKHVVNADAAVPIVSRIVERLARP